ncbi:MAG: YihY/virulence factor BrkB family protein [Anaerolineales bacterium]|nr:YihY/virulence factor BrkB family protein [Anaerolineales bacterium]
MKLRSLLTLIRDAGIGWSLGDAPVHAAALAYFALFSIAPMLIISVVIASQLFSQTTVEAQILYFVSHNMGAEAARFVLEIIRNHHNSTSNRIATGVGIILLLYGASALFFRLRASFNVMWGLVPKTLPFHRSLLYIIESRLLSGVYVFVVVFFLIFNLLLYAVLAALSNRLTPGQSLSLVRSYSLLQLLLSPVLLILIFAAAYKYLPQAGIRWRDTWLGAIITTFLFWLGNFIIGLYLGRSGLASFYGAAGSAIVFLIWVYYSASIVLYGAKLTQLYAQRYGAGITPDSSMRFKDERPMPQA